MMKPMTNRRQFLLDSTALIASAAYCRGSFAQTGASAPAAAEVVPGELVVDLASPSHLIPQNYTGVSYELAQLTDPNFFAASNKQLIALFRLMSAQGVLR